MARARAVVVAYVWRTVPFGALLFHAALQAIPDSLYESASIGGATSWQQWWYITIPLLPIIMTSKVEQMTLPVLIPSIVTLKFFSYTLTYAAGLLAILPTLLLAPLLQRYVVSRLTGAP